MKSLAIIGIVVCMTTDNPALRIVNNETGIRSRRDGHNEAATSTARDATTAVAFGAARMRRCETQYVDKRSQYLRCSRMIETGLCENRTSVSTRLGPFAGPFRYQDPARCAELIYEYVREYHRAWAELHNSTKGFGQCGEVFV